LTARHHRHQHYHRPKRRTRTRTRKFTLCSDVEREPRFIESTVKMSFPPIWLNVSECVGSFYCCWKSVYVLYFCVYVEFAPTLVFRMASVRYSGSKFGARGSSSVVRFDLVGIEANFSLSILQSLSFGLIVVLLVILCCLKA
jgi:hypothetical protein